MFQKSIKLIGISTSLLCGLVIAGSLVTGFGYENLRNNLDRACGLNSAYVEEEDIKPSNTEGPLSQMMQLNFP